MKMRHFINSVLRAAPVHHPVIELVAISAPYGSRELFIGPEKARFYYLSARVPAGRKYSRALQVWLAIRVP